MKRDETETVKVGRRPSDMERVMIKMLPEISLSLFMEVGNLESVGDVMKIVNTRGHARSAKREVILGWAIHDFITSPPEERLRRLMRGRQDQLARMQSSKMTQLDLGMPELPTDPMPGLTRPDSPPTRPKGRNRGDKGGDSSNRHSG